MHHLKLNKGSSDFFYFNKHHPIVQEDFKNFLHSDNFVRDLTLFLQHHPHLTSKQALFLGENFEEARLHSNSILDDLSFDIGNISDDYSQKRLTHIDNRSDSDFESSGGSLTRDNNSSETSIVKKSVQNNISASNVFSSIFNLEPLII